MLGCLREWMQIVPAFFHKQKTEQAPAIFADGLENFYIK